MAGPGAGVTVDGIAARPDYAFDPPADFFASGTPSGPLVVDAGDFGAVADPAVDNRPMIQAAIDFAHAQGGGIVYLPPGTYGIGADPLDDGAVKLLDNVFLKGAGMGVTVLQVLDGFDGVMAGIVRSPSGKITSNWGVADLTLDGNRDQTPGSRVDAFFSGVTPGKPGADADVYVLRVEAVDCSRYGFDPHERTERLSIVDSVAHGNLDGFVLDYVIDGEITGNLSWGNDRHGFNVVTSSNDLLLADNVARDNGASGFTVQRGSENIPSPTNIVIRDSESYANGREGVLVKMSSNVLLERLDVHDNGRAGVRLSGSTHVTLADSRIEDNSQAAGGTFSSVVIEAFADGVTRTTFAATDNLISGTLVRDGALPAGRIGIEEAAGPVGRNILDGNDISGHFQADLALSAADSFLRATGTGAADHMLGSQFQDLLLGGAGDDTLEGGIAADRLDGGTGADTLIGGSGDDVYLIDDAGDLVVEEDLPGSDSVRSTLVATRLGEQVENLQLGTGALRGTGNGLDNRLTGNGLDNVLAGAGGDDVLRGQGGADRLKGGAGADTLVGGRGRDTLTGGTGRDRFVFESVKDSPGGRGDVITDFKPKADLIDLSAIDADAATAGDQAFRFIGSSAFDRHAGQLHVVAGPSGLRIEADVDGDGRADLQIDLATTHPLSAADFVL